MLTRQKICKGKQPMQRTQIRGTAIFYREGELERKALREKLGGLSPFESTLACFLPVQFPSFLLLAKARECLKPPTKEKIHLKALQRTSPRLRENRIILGLATSFSYICSKLTKGTKQECGFQGPESFAQLFSVNDTGFLP